MIPLCAVEKNRFTDIQPGRGSPRVGMSWPDNQGNFGGEFWDQNRLARKSFARAIVCLVSPYWE